MSLSAVLFDMDGLLVDTEPLWLRAEREVMGQLGSSWTVEDQRAVLGGPLSHAAAYMARRAGSPLPPEEIGGMLVAEMAVQLRTGRITLQPGAAELVGVVAAAGVPRALVSASLRVLMDLVLVEFERRGLPAFPVTVAGDEVHATKPDPAPYLLAADLLGVDIARAVVLEDSPNGVRSGRASGATVIAVPHLVPIAAGQGVVIRDSLVGLDVDQLEAVSLSRA